MTRFNLTHLSGLLGILPLREEETNEIMPVKLHTRNNPRKEDIHRIKPRRRSYQAKLKKKHCFMSNEVEDKCKKASKKQIIRDEMILSDCTDSDTVEEGVGIVQTQQNPFMRVQILESSQIDRINQQNEEKQQFPESEDSILHSRTMYTSNLLYRDYSKGIKSVKFEDESDIVLETSIQHIQHSSSSF